MYCTGKKKALVRYNLDGNQKIFIANESFLPIDVQASYENRSSTGWIEYTQSFDGRTAATYPFTITAPSYVPKKKQVNILLSSSFFDDYGTIGGYTEGQQTQTRNFSPPIQIGTGLSISGSVRNTLPVLCYYRATVKWDWGSPYSSIEIFDKVGNNIFVDEGTSPITYTVTCDDKCPEGYLKLDSLNYPGYCCIPCSEVVGGIKSITAAVRGLNRG